MSAEELSALPWRMWLVQTLAVLRMEWKKSFWGKRAIWIYLLALAPIALTGGHSLVVRYFDVHCSLSEDATAFAAIFHVYFLRLGIFLGCVWIFSSLIRGEVLERTLHYYLLTPARREIVILGKYLAGLLASLVFFVGSTAISFLLVSAHFGGAYREYILHGPGLSQLEWYSVSAALACVGYGSVFLLAGLVYGNPMIPAAVVMIWESINIFLPSTLQKLSVIFYLRTLAPVEVPPEGPLALLAVVTEPTPAWLAIPGLLLVSLMLLVFAGLRARRLEVSYVE